MKEKHGFVCYHQTDMNSLSHTKKSAIAAGVLSGLTDECKKMYLIGLVHLLP
jgi:hypothetical protein